MRLFILFILLFITSCSGGSSGTTESILNDSIGPSTEEKIPFVDNREVDLDFYNRIYPEEGDHINSAFFYTNNEIDLVGEETHTYSYDIIYEEDFTETHGVSWLDICSHPEGEGSITRLYFDITYDQEAASNGEMYLFEGFCGEPVECGILDLWTNPLYDIMVFETELALCGTVKEKIISEVIPRLREVDAGDQDDEIE